MAQCLRNVGLVDAGVVQIQEPLLRRARWRQDWWTAHGLCESQECDLGREGLSGALNLVVAV